MVTMVSEVSAESGFFVGTPEFSMFLMHANLNVR